MNNRYSIFIGIGILAFIASFTGVIYNDLYRDGEWISAQWFGQDIVTVIAVVPLYFISMWFGFKKGSIKWQIAMIGFLTYFVYTYAIYVFTAKFTWLYFLHLGILSLSIYSIVKALKPFLAGKSTFANRNKYIGSAISVYFILISIMLIILWMSDLLSFLFSKGYRSETPDGEPPLVIYSLDLGFVIPLMLAGIILFWKRKSIGYLITGIMLTKLTTLGFALMGMSISMYFRHVVQDSFLAFLWFILGVAGLALTILYFVYLKINVLAEKK